MARILPAPWNQRSDPTKSPGESASQAAGITTIGVDIAKNVFQIHGVDVAGKVSVRRKVRRDQFLAVMAGLDTCLVGMEACATAHHLARELVMLGHDVRLMPPIYVKAYVKRNKNDAADAEAICEAVTRPTMRFVPVKSIEAQSILMLHRTRHLLVRQRTVQVSAIRAHLAEYGIVVPAGRRHVPELIELLRSENDLPSPALRALLLLAEVIETVDGQIGLIEAEIAAWHRNNEICRRIATIPGIGVISATALVATVVDAEAFHSGRQFAAWPGLVPRQNSSGGKERQGAISKMGDRYLRTLLILGATAMIRRLKGSSSALGISVTGLLSRKPARVVTVALANKLARIVWAIMVRGEAYRAVVMTA